MSENQFSIIYENEEYTYPNYLDADSFNMTKIEAIGNAKDRMVNEARRAAYHGYMFKDSITNAKILDNFNRSNKFINISFDGKTFNISIEPIEMLNREAVV
jgi:hypothetical protein